MEWNENKILEFINQGWTLSYDKTNQKYKLQKRINGKVKSYTLPKQFNEFCNRIKKEKELSKYLEIFKDIDSGSTVDEINEKYGLKYIEIEEIFKKYVEWKLNKNELKDLLFIILYELRFYELWRIDEIKERLNRASWLIRHSLGSNRIMINCPICKKWGYLELKEVKVGNRIVTNWVCSNCGKIPF